MTGEDVRAAQARAQADGAALTRAIQTRRRRKCIAAGDHNPTPPPDPDGQTKCPRCGL